MAKVTITIADLDEPDAIDIDVKYDPEVALDSPTPAQQLSADFIELLHEQGVITDLVRIH